MGDFDLLAYGSVVEALGAANRHLRRRAYPLSAIPHFGGQATSHSVGGIIPAQVKATTHIGERMDFDRLIIFSDEASANTEDPRVSFWLSNLHQRGVHLVGVGAGSLVLARSGITAAEPLTTHPRSLEALAALGSTEKPQQTRLAVHGSISSSAGGASALDFTLTLIGQDFGGEVSQAVRRMLIAPPPRHAASSAIPETDLANGNGSVRRMLAAMRNNLAEPLSLAAVARAGGVSIRQANRLFAQRTGRSTMETYRRLRLESAVTLLRHSDQSVTQIALLTGFGGSPPLARHFKALFGITPRAFRANPQIELVADGPHSIEQEPPAQSGKGQTEGSLEPARETRIA
ncbi:MAG: helix-turn-helix domain-containing protein [Pseudomonadota bacterium]